MCGKYYTIIFLAFFFSNVYANDKVTEITWLHSDAAPFHLNKTIQTPTGGLCDPLIDMLIDNLPNIKHTRMLVPQKRIGKYLDEGKLACYPCMIHQNQKTNRATYSIPTAVYPTFNIITTPKIAHKITLEHGAPVSLISLLSDNEYLFGQSAARKFTKSINEIAYNTKVYRKASLSWNSENESQAVIARLNHGYIDYTIDYPFLADYYNRYDNLNKVVTLPIANQKDKLVLGAIGCSSNAPNHFAENAIKQINTVLKQIILPSARYQASQRQWLEPTFADFNKYYQQQILHTTELANTAQPEAHDSSKVE